MVRDDPGTLGTVGVSSVGNGNGNPRRALGRRLNFPKSTSRTEPPPRVREETELRVAFRDVVRTISLALEMDERGKLNHGVRVGLMAHRIGDVLGMNDAPNLYYAGLLHDLGAMGVADQVIHDAMYDRHGPELQQHPERGAQIVRPLAVLRPFEEVIRDHHERYDGAGFPQRKCGEEIPLGASVIRLADHVEFALRAASPSNRASRVTRAIDRERAGGVPTRVAEAASELFSSEPSFLELLCDDAALEDTLSSFCPPAPGTDRLSRSELHSQLLWVLARVVDAKHAHTMGHSARVAHFGFRIAQAFNDSVNAWDVAWAGLLHDVGMVAVPRKVLEHAGALDEDDLRIVRSHADDSRRVIATIRDLAHLALPAAAHHERYDGAGYPQGLSGEGIPFIGRILAYADVYDALTTARSYREALGHAEALSQMRSLVGTVLDPHLASAALDALQRQRADAADGRAVSFSRFFESDNADLDGAFGRESGTGTVLRTPTKSGAPLLALDPWIPFEITDDLTLDGPPGALDALTGANSVRLVDAFDPESVRDLLDVIGKLGRAETHTQYLFTRAGRPLEVIVQRHDGRVRLLCQSAERRLQTMDRIALYYRNFLSSAEAIVFADPRGNIVDVNQSFIDLFGYSREEIVGKHTRMLRSGRQDQSFYREMWQSITDGTRASWSGELVDRRKDGREIDVRLSIEAVRDAMGACIGFLAHMTDVTARKRAEAELLLRKQELVAANEELQRVSRFKDELIAMTSHDLRGPLGAIANLAALVRENLGRLPREKVAGHLERIRETAAKLTEFASDLLDLDKTESGQLVLRPCRVRLDELLSQCVERVQAASTKSVAIDLRLCSDSLELLADPVRTEQIFANLIANAVKFSPEGETVSVEASYDEARGCCVVHVNDHGPGIPEDSLEAVFDRYYQVDRHQTATARGIGSGLGLHIVRTLVTLHRGSVRAENRKSGGCRFVVELPVDRAAPELARPVVVLLARPSHQRETLMQMLRDLGAHVMCAETGERVRALCALTGADVLLYDEPACDSATLAFASGRCATSELPVVARVCEPANDVSGPPSGCTLIAPVLESELRELLREASLRRGTR